MKPKIDIKETKSILDLKRILGNKQLFVSDETQNKYGYIEIDNEIRCGIAYYDYGIKPCLIMEDEQVLWVAFGKKLVIIDIQNKKTILEKTLSSVFFEMISDTFEKYICIVCELDLYCVHLHKIVWKMGFRDIICNFEIINDSRIKVECNDGEEYSFTLNKGKFIN